MYDHDLIAIKLARKFKSAYRRKGVDILSKGRAIEVAVSPSDLYQSIRQLKRSRAAKKYLVVPPHLVQKARELLKGTGIGIMNPRGQIRKKCRKK